MASCAKLSQPRYHSLCDSRREYEIEGIDNLHRTSHRLPHGGPHRRAGIFVRPTFCQATSSAPQIQTRILTLPTGLAEDSPAGRMLLVKPGRSLFHQWLESRRSELRSSTTEFPLIWEQYLKHPHRFRNSSARTTYWCPLPT